MLQTLQDMWNSGSSFWEHQNWSIGWKSRKSRNSFSASKSRSPFSALWPVFSHQIDPFWCSKKLEPEFHMYWRVCNVLVGLESNLGGFFEVRCHKVEIPSWLQNCDCRILLFDLYFSTRLTNFDALKGFNPIFTCPEEPVKFWWVYLNI